MILIGHLIEFENNCPGEPFTPIPRGIDQCGSHAPRESRPVSRNSVTSPRHDDPTVDPCAASSIVSSRPPIAVCASSAHAYGVTFSSRWPTISRSLPVSATAVGTARSGQPLHRLTPGTSDEAGNSMRRCGSRFSSALIARCSASWTALSPTGSRLLQMYRGSPRSPGRAESRCRRAPGRRRAARRARPV